MSLETQVTALVSAANDLTGAVNTKMTAIDQKATDAQADVDSYLISARSENAIYRQTKNQNGNLTAGMLDNFSANAGFTITISLYRTILSGIAWASRDLEEKEILTAMGMANVVNFQPSIRVMKKVWSGFVIGNTNYTIYPNPIVNLSGMVTVASYAKIITGSIWNHWLHGANNEWGLCGANMPGNPGGYLHAHPQVSTASGEVLFIWPAAVSGYVPLDRNNPKWGYYPSMYGENPFDATPGT